MINIKSTYKYFDVKQQPNTFYSYNHKMCNYLKKNFDWFTQISENKYNEIKNKIGQIESKKSKEYIEPYYNVYSTYLPKYKNIFKTGNTFIDCGCAPGGFLKFANEIGMKGYGITLEPAKENEGLALKYSTDVIYGNLFDESFLNSLDDKISEKVDFINMGAVSYERTDDSYEHARLFLNQFYVAKKFLKKNGTIMFVLDIFHTLFNLILTGSFFTELGCKIHFIPVQPGFQSTQVYILIENVPEITDDIFQRLITIKDDMFFLIVDGYIKIAKKMFTSSYFDLNSFKDAYLITFLSKKTIEKKTNVIKHKLIPTMIIDIITKSNYNFHYLVYEEFLGNVFRKGIYNTSAKSERDKMITRGNKARREFIDKNNLPVDSNNNIIVKGIKYTRELYIEIDKISKKLHKIFISYVLQ
jgi:FtsJ-like methyltransferase